MREFIRLTLIGCACVLGFIPDSVHALPAFPGAEGYGSETPGGRGGRVIAVTTLTDGGPGSLREAVTAPGPRTIVFRVAGEIRLKSHLRVTEPFVTIAGQTAPGTGIVIRDAGFYIQTHDVVVRYIRSRVGDSLVEEFDTQDALQISGDEAHNVVVDHCSLSWSIDECVGIRTPAHDVTFSWNIVSEALRQPFTAEQIGKDRSHSMALILSGGPTRCSLHHNLLAHCNSRNPRIQGGRHAFVNNVVYDWGWLSGTFSRHPEVNFIGNYYAPGRASKDLKAICENPDQIGLIYARGNRSPHRPGDWLPEWIPIVNAPADDHRADGPFDMPAITTASADEAYEMVLRDAGATLPIRDAVDRRVVRDVRLGMGVKIDRPAEVGGYPEMKSDWPLPVPTDADSDGMPDDWERVQGFDPNDPADSRQDAAGDGYTNLEAYLEYLVDRQRIPRPAVRTLSIDRPGSGPFAVHVGEVELDAVSVGRIERTFYNHSYFTDELAVDVASAEPNASMVYATMSPVRFHNHLDTSAGQLAFRVAEEGPRVIQQHAGPDSPRLVLLFDSFPDSAPSFDDDNVIDPRRFGVLGRRAKVTAKLQAALDAAARIPGGGVVFLADGQHEIDTIRIPDNVTLHLGRSAVLYASDASTGEAMILFDGVEDAALTGQGVVDGRGSELIPRSQGVTNGSHRPILRIRNSKLIRVEDLVLREPAGLGIEVLNSDKVSLHRAKVIAATDCPNAGGLRIDGSSNVTCFRSFVSGNGDGITIESTDRAGVQKAHDIMIRETVILAGKTGVVVGPDVQAEMRRILFRDVDVVSAARGISVTRSGPGTIDNVTFRDMNMSLYEVPGDPTSGQPFCVTNTAEGMLHNVLFDRVHTNALRTSIIEGRGSAWVDHIKFWGVRVKAEKTAGPPLPDSPPLFDLNRARSPEFRFLYVTWPEHRETHWGQLLGTNQTESLKAPDNEIFQITDQGGSSR